MARPLDPSGQIGVASVPTNPTFELSFKVPEADIDIQGHINNVAFLRYVQDAAVAHWNAVAAADLRTRLTWVVRKHEIEYFRPGLPGDELAVKTWVGEASGATWERFTEVHRRGEDRPLVASRTVWVLLDLATGRPRRVDDAFVTTFLAADRARCNTQPATQPPSNSQS